MATKLPVTSDSPDYEFFTDLDTVTFLFRFKWIDRMNQWVLSVFDDQLSPVFEGWALVLGIDYIRLSADTRFPGGELRLVNYESEFTECGRNDLGETCQLVYIPEGE